MVGRDAHLIHLLLLGRKVMIDSKEPCLIFFLNYLIESSHCGAVETNPTKKNDVSDLIPGLTQWVKDPALPRAVV